MGNLRVAIAGIAMCFALEMAQGQVQQSRAPQPGEEVTTPAAQRPRQFGQQPQLRAKESARGSQERRGRPAEEKSSVTHHSARIGGQEIEYTATAGTYV